jgi:hypothetical protein
VVKMIEIVMVGDYDGDDCNERDDGDNAGY